MTTAGTVSPIVQLIDYVVEELALGINTAYRDDPDRALELAEADPLPQLGLEIQWTPPSTLQPTKSPSAAAKVSSETGDSPETHGEEQPATENERFQVGLIVRANDHDDFEAQCLYRVCVRINGLFSRPPRAALGDETADDEYAAHTLASGISVLYGAARNVVATITSQSPYPKMMLPTISPMLFAQRVLAEGDELGGGQAAPPQAEEKEEALGEPDRA